MTASGADVPRHLGDPGVVRRGPRGARGITWSRRGVPAVPRPITALERADSRLEPLEDGLERADSLVEPLEDGLERADSRLEPLEDGLERADSRLEPSGGCLEQPRWRPRVEDGRHLTVNRPPRCQSILSPGSSRTEVRVAASELRRPLERQDCMRASTRTNHAESGCSGSVTSTGFVRCRQQVRSHG